ncbi:MAG: hypothetical protein ACKO2P_04105 [Planctomycetota bacterium]
MFEAGIGVRIRRKIGEASLGKGSDAWNCPKIQRMPDTAGSGWQIHKPNAKGIGGIICQELPNSEKKGWAIEKKMKEFWKKTVGMTIPAIGLGSRAIVKPANPP